MQLGGFYIWRRIGLPLIAAGVLLVGGFWLGNLGNNGEAGDQGEMPALAEFQNMVPTLERLIPVDTIHGDDGGWANV